MSIKPTHTPPLLNARQMFFAGLTLTAAGVALTLVTDGWLSAFFESAPIPYAIDGSVAALLREIALTLGLVLIGISTAVRSLSPALPQGEQSRSQ